MDLWWAILHDSTATREISDGFENTVLSNKEFDSITEGQSRPILLLMLRFDVPELIATKLLHLIPNQAIKSAAATLYDE